MRKSIIILFLIIGGVLVSCKKDELFIPKKEDPIPPQKEDPFTPPYQSNLTDFEVSLSKTNNLRAEVTATFSGETSFHIAYWEVNHPEQVQQTNTYQGKGIERKTLLFLEPDTQYSCQIITEKGDKSAVKTFKTKSVEAFLPNATLLIDDLKEDIGGYFFANARMNGTKAIYLTDTKGVVVWYEQVPEEPLVVNYDAQRQQFYILTNPAYPVGSPYTFNAKSIKIIDLFGEVVFQKDFATVPALNGREVHHECRPMPDGSIGLVTYIDKTFDLTAQGGTTTDTVKGDGFVIMNRKGEITQQWSCFDYVDPTTDPNIKIQGVKEDWLHANSFNYDSEGNYYMTFNRYGELWKIDGKTGKLLYRIGENGTIKPEKKYFTHGMHCANPKAPNEVLVIDNARSDSDTGSRAILYKVNEQSKTVTVPMAVALPKDLSSSNRSNAQFIGEDLLLITLSTKKQIIITDRNETPTIKRSFMLPFTFSRAQYIPTIKY